MEKGITVVVNDKENVIPRKINATPLKGLVFVDAKTHKEPKKADSIRIPNPHKG
jgi:hypothetical protein